MREQSDRERKLRFIRPERAEKENPSEYVAHFKVMPGDTVMDLGCGPGFFSQALLDAAGEGGSLIVVDRNIQMLELFDEHCPVADRAKTIHADFPPLDLEDGSVDLIWSANTLHEFADLYDAAREMWRLLRSGGRIAMHDWDVVQSEGGPPIEKRMKRELAAEFFRRAGFAQVETGNISSQKYYVRAVKV